MRNVRKKPAKPIQAAPRSPIKAHKPQVIVKLSRLLAQQPQRVVAIPDIVLIANAAGFRALARCLQKWARVAAKLESGTGVVCPWDHRSYSMAGEPFDSVRSDQVEFRIAALDPRCKQEIIERFDATPERAKRGDMSSWHRGGAQEPGVKPKRRNAAAKRRKGPK